MQRYLSEDVNCYRHVYDETYYFIPTEMVPEVTQPPKMNCPRKQRAQFHKQLNPNQPLLMAIYPVDFFPQLPPTPPQKFPGLRKKTPCFGITFNEKKRILRKQLRFWWLSLKSSWPLLWKKHQTPGAKKNRCGFPWHPNIPTVDLRMCSYQLLTADGVMNGFAG